MESKDWPQIDLSKCPVPGKDEKAWIGEPGMIKLESYMPYMPLRRDYFAAAALTGLLAAGWSEAKKSSAEAFEYADAMIEAGK